MGQDVSIGTAFGDQKLLGLARELALDIKPRADVLKEYSMSEAEFERVSNLPLFRRYFEQEVTQWQASLAAPDRVRIKSAAVLEEWLPELYRRMLDRSEALSSKVEAGKLLAKMAEIGNPRPGVGDGGGERFSVTINLGSDQSLRFEKTVTPRVIEAEEVDG
jgi:hypothetical protein